MIAYIQRNLRIKGKTTIVYYNCRLCPNRLWTDYERENGICTPCTDKAIEFKPVVPTPRKKADRLSDGAMQKRIDTIVNRERPIAQPKG